MRRPGSEDPHRRERKFDSPSFYTFYNFVLFHPVLDPLLPGPDVPHPDVADGDDDHDREHEDAHQDGNDHICWVS